MSSGVAVNEECLASFQKFFEEKRIIRYIIYRIENGEIVVDVTASSDDLHTAVDDYEENSKVAYEAFLKDLMNRTQGSDCRYAVFDFKFMWNKHKMNKIVFVHFCPESASVKKRMIYASSVAALKSILGTGRIIRVQASEESEIAHEEILKMLQENCGNL